MTTAFPSDDAVLDALEGAAATMESAAEDSQAVARDLRRVGAARRNGHRWRDILGDGAAPQLLDRLGSVAKRIGGSASALRRAMVRALADDGLRIGQIGQLLNVSHQRVSQIMQPRTALSLDDTEVGSELD
jgi:hypothetical protein